MNPAPGARTWHFSRNRSSKRQGRIGRSQNRPGSESRRHSQRMNRMLVAGNRYPLANLLSVISRKVSETKNSQTLYRILLDTTDKKGPNVLATCITCHVRMHLRMYICTYLPLIIKLLERTSPYFTEQSNGSFSPRVTKIITQRVQAFHEEVRPGHW